MNCRLCNSNNIKEKFIVEYNNYNFKIYECKNCLFQFQNISKDNAYKFYNKEYYSQESTFSYQDERKTEIANRIVWEKRIKKLKSYDFSNIENPKFLDIGCAFGGLLQCAKEAGYDVYGVEVSEYSGNYSKERFGNNKIWIGSIEDIELPKNYFSVITMIEVIEHLYDPVIALEKLYDSLVSGGVCLIQTANISGLQAKIFGNKYHYYLPGHLSYFNHKNLINTMKKIGFSKTKFIGGVEFGVLPKLLKSRYSFKNYLDYFKWVRIILYHYLSKIKIGDIHFTSSMVVLGWK